MKFHVKYAVFVLSTSMIIAPVHAQDVAPDKGGTANAQVTPADLPSAEEILQRYVDVTGGADAYAKIRNRRGTGTMEISAQGIKGNITVWQARPNLFLLEANFPALGSTVSAFNGEIGWELSVMGGPRLIENDELAQLRRSSYFSSETDWNALYKSIECVGTATINNKQCYEVRLTPKDEGMPIRSYYDKESGLLVKTVMTVKNPMGEIEIESFPSDYREVDGILMPHKNRQRMMGSIEMTMVMDKIEQNIEFPEDRFEPPAEIKALLEQAKKNKGKPGAAGETADDGGQGTR